MRNVEKLVDVAKYLYSHVSTIWDNYDFTEKSVNYEHRVPEFSFDVSVEFMKDEVYHNQVSLHDEKYARVKHIKYQEEVYIFVVTTWLHAGVVSRYSMEIFTPAGDGKGGYYRLYDVRSLA